MPPLLEYRAMSLPTEVREAAPGEPRRLAGYAAKYNVLSGVLKDPRIGKFQEVLAPGCFDRTLREKPDVRALFGHNRSAVLGRTKSGTLALDTDDVGLRYGLEMPDTTLGRDALTMLDRGDIGEMSFGFDVVEDEVQLRPGLPALRTILDLDLFEISLVSFPAYDGTTVELRSHHTRTVSLTTPRLDLARRRLRLLSRD